MKPTSSPASLIALAAARTASSHSASASPRQDAFDHPHAAGVAVQAGAAHDVLAHRAVRGDAGHIGQLPGPRPEAEVSGGQRAHRADVGGVAAEVGVKRRIADGDDLQAAAPLMEGQHVIADQLLLKAHAAPALDAALAVQEDQVAQRDVFGQLHLVGEVHTAETWPVPHGQVLQRALAALVADRAVQRVAAEQVFQHVSAGLLHRLGGGADVQACRHGGGAGRGHRPPPANLRRAVVVEDRLAGGAVAGLNTQLHQAHATHADRLHLGMVTEDRDLDVGINAGGIHQVHPGGDLVRHTIDVEGYGFGHPSAFDVRSALVTRIHRRPCPLARPGNSPDFPTANVSPWPSAPRIRVCTNNYSNVFRLFYRRPPGRGIENIVTSDGPDVNDNVPDGEGTRPP